jgi:hypothetical protein
VTTVRRVLDQIEQRKQQYQRHSLFTFLGQTQIAPTERLAFIPALGHFVMSFADLYRLVLREEPAADRFQEIVNAHTFEDGDHWRWFLHDLGKLGEDRSVRLTEALQFLWSGHTARTRMLTYRICRLGLGASSLQKLVVVLCIEAAGRVSLSASAPVAQEWSAANGAKLVYFGSHHVETEAQHTVEDNEIAGWLAQVSLAADEHAIAGRVIDEVFSACDEFAADLLDIADARRTQRAAELGGQP